MNNLRQPSSQGLYAPGTQAGTGGSSGVDPSIGTLAQLAAIPTTTLTPPVIKLWMNESTGMLETWRLLAGTDATASGIQRPDDWAASQKVWYQASAA